MSQAKQPKPFLKRGTRQYLSNATVRSLNQKPNIVDFAEAEEGNEIKQTNSFKSQQREIKLEIKVSNKPRIKEDGKSNSRSKQNKSTNQQSQTSTINQRSKKTAVLDDYLMVPASNKKEGTRQNTSKQKLVSCQPVISVQPKISMVGLLKRQDQDLESEEQQSVKHPKNEFVKEVRYSNPAQSTKKTAYRRQEEADNGKVQFQSDSSDEEKPNLKINPKKPLSKQVDKSQHTGKWDQEQPQQRGPSKVLQKFYKKEPERIQPQKGPQNKITIADITQPLKQQIFHEMLAERQSGLEKKLKELEQTIHLNKKEKEKFEEENKRLAKEKEEFIKEMERKHKEFDEKVASENSKLTREKRYLKGQQMEGKGDWKAKNETEELRNKLQLSEAEKRKTKAQMSRQIDRLKKKVEEVSQQNQSLIAQIKCVEMEKIEIKTKELKQKPERRIERHWENVPTRSYVSSFFDQKFTLISLEPHFYDYRHIEYYCYYLSKKDQEEVLINEEKDLNGSKITRRYKSGKEEVQYINRATIETFPFKFTIKHLVSGQVTMTLPEGITVHYDNKNQITEFRINQNKRIYYFHRLNQTQLKYKTRQGEVKEVYKNVELIRTLESGQIVRYRRSQNGAIVML